VLSSFCRLGAPAHIPFFKKSTAAWLCCRYIEDGESGELSKEALSFANIVMFARKKPSAAMAALPYLPYPNCDLPGLEMADYPTKSGTTNFSCHTEVCAPATDTVPQAGLRAADRQISSGLLIAIPSRYLDVNPSGHGFLGQTGILLSLARSLH
jgi:hypothetical protein